jgi:Rhodopirellula transposase DDE domain
MSTRKWLKVRLRAIQARLVEVGHAISLPVISRLLQAQDYRLRVNQKNDEGGNHPERDRQFTYLREQRAWHEQAGQPRLSIDTKKKELVGNFKNAGKVWCQHPEIVKTHDFPSEAEGRAVPYGIYDPQHNQATVYVGQSADTPEFAVDNLVSWCQTDLRQRFPSATHLMLEADGGGSNSSRSRVFKQQLQDKIADPFGLIVTVCHYPPGASKWNPIEHRLFSEISKTWQGCPLRSFDLVLDYINATHTQTGLKVKAQLVTRTYQTGLKVSDETMQTLHIRSHETCPQWNYSISPRPKPIPPT